MSKKAMNDHIAEAQKLLDMLKKITDSKDSVNDNQSSVHKEVDQADFIRKQLDKYLNSLEKEGIRPGDAFKYTVMLLTQILIRANRTPIGAMSHLNKWIGEGVDCYLIAESQKGCDNCDCDDDDDEEDEDEV